MARQDARKLPAIAQYLKCFFLNLPGFGLAQMVPTLSIALMFRRLRRTYGQALFYLLASLFLKHYFLRSLSRPDL